MPDKKPVLSESELKIRVKILGKIRELFEESEFSRVQEMLMLVDLDEIEKVKERYGDSLIELSNYLLETEVVFGKFAPRKKELYFES